MVGVIFLQIKQYPLPLYPKIVLQFDTKSEPRTHGSIRKLFAMKIHGSIYVLRGKLRRLRLARIPFTLDPHSQTNPLCKE